MIISRRVSLRSSMVSLLGSRVSFLGSGVRKRIKRKDKFKVKRIKYRHRQMVHKSNEEA
jgi:hypothetical protein